MQRRDFIIISTGAALALGATYWYLAYDSHTKSYSSMAPESLSHIWDETTIRNMGTAYRSEVPKEDNEQLLIQLLNKDHGGGYQSIAALREKIKNDFETENTIIIDGWILSVTEARQCALFSIIPSK
ncbi:MAG: hypothetical protein WBG90_08195 [Saonia sp.]